MRARARVGAAGSPPIQLMTWSRRPRDVVGHLALRGLQGRAAPRRGAGARRSIYAAMSSFQPSLDLRVMVVDNRGARDARRSAHRGDPLFARHGSAQNP